MDKKKILAPLLAFGMFFSLALSHVYAEEATVTMKAGDTLWSIAQAHGVTVSDLMEWNPGLTPSSIPVGTVIKVAADSDHPSSAYFHTVKAGETFYSIANLYEDVTVDDLYMLNPLVDPLNMNVGTELRIRSDEHSEFHIVKAGDTLYSIANLYEGLLLRDLYAMNPGIDPSNLQIESAVRIMSADLVQEFYTVKAGDTLFRIALNSGVTLNDLYELNPGIDPHTLQIGKEIRIR